MEISCHRSHMIDRLVTLAVVEMLGMPEVLGRLGMPEVLGRLGMPEVLGRLVMLGAEVG